MSDNRIQATVAFATMQGTQFDGECNDSPFQIQLHIICDAQDVRRFLLRKAEKALLDLFDSPDEIVKTEPT